MEVDTGDTVGTVIAVSGEWEPHITEVVRRLTSPGDVFVDVGAHIGYYTLLASVLVGDQGHVYAFEPSPARWNELRANVARNKLGNVTAFEMAAGAYEGETILYEAPRTNTSASTLLPAALDPSAATEYSPKRVRVTPVPTHLAAKHLDRVRVIKIDVEGFEIDVLRGLERVLAGRRPLSLIIEVSPDWSSGSDVAFIEQLCRSHEFVPWRVSNEYTLDAYFPLRVVPPIRVDAIPEERADLVLARGMDLDERRR